MNTKYQVFVSSTYVDLKDARQNVIQTVMQMDCIPSGMELFPAIDEEQFNFIKKVIDDCDYYILILAGKYGSLASDGLSYTEKEYNYAIEKNKKVLAFVFENLDDLPPDKKESNPINIEILNKFRTQVCSGRIVKMWRNIEDLPGHVALSLSRTIKTYPTQGWVRGGFTPSVEILMQLDKLRRENAELKNELSALKAQLKPKFEDIAGLEQKIRIFFIFKRAPTLPETFDDQVSWQNIFYAISPFLEQYQNEDYINGILAKYLAEEHAGKKYHSGKLDKQPFQTIRE
jgi:hypothetical protein